MVRRAGFAGADPVCGGGGKKLRSAFRNRFRLIGKTPAEVEIELWKAELAASEEHGEDWIRADVGPIVEYEPRPWHDLYFRAFDALQYDRFFGAMGGEGPIFYQALSCYARDHGLTGLEFLDFQIFMNALDGEYLSMRREKTQRAADGSSAGG
ncbi:hypothetical protein [Rhizobium sp. SGZ-381]|uniref:hypothetical protein n=1 Tax=Rhizobium sp. SGZ-381 TaxID=3342800 RepID=UPI0036722CB5